MATAIQDFQNKLQIINSEQNSSPTNEDLNYLYNVKRMLSDSITPALKEMDNLLFQKNGNVIKEIISMGLMGENEAIIEENEDESFR